MERLLVVDIMMMKSLYKNPIMFTGKRMIWILSLSVLVFLHSRIVGIVPLVLCIIGIRSFNKATEESVLKSQRIMKWAFITLVISIVVLICLMTFIAQRLF